MRGMAMSHTTRSGARALASATASTPLLAEMVSKPSSPSSSLTLLSSSGSSSTTSTLGIAGCAPHADGGGATRGERRAAGFPEAARFTQDTRLAPGPARAGGAGLRRGAARHALRLERQPDAEHAAAPHLTLHVDRAALYVERTFDDGQTETRARHRAHVL